LLQADSFKELSSKIALSQRPDIAGQPSEAKQKIVAGVQKWVNIFVGLTIVGTVLVGLGYIFRLRLLFGERKHFARYTFMALCAFVKAYAIVFRKALAGHHIALSDSYKRKTSD
jgi:hypothetical protein